jgi:hypothetical protein
LACIERKHQLTRFTKKDSQVVRPVEYQDHPEDWMDKANREGSIFISPSISAGHPMSYVYFVRSAGLIKIGKANTLIKRLLTLAGSSASEISLLGYIEICTEEVFLKEAWLHEQFKEYHHHGEWFEESSLLHNYILTVCNLECTEINSRLRNFYTKPYRMTMTEAYL